MPTSRLWIGRSLAAAGLVLAAATGGVILSESAPAQSIGWGEVDETLRVSAPSVPVHTSASAYAATPPFASTPAPSSTVVSRPSTSASPTPDQLSSTTSVDDRGDHAIDPAMPSIPPSPAVHLRIPAIAVDAKVLPVDSVPTGARNAWGGEVFAPIDFPVDKYVRQWIRRGDPNSVPSAESVSNVKAFDRTVLYGHASDIGNHLVFQDLSELRAGDSITVDTALGRFVYAVTTVATRAKADLDNMAALYDYPTDGKKELALIACLPDTTSNVVVFATLVSAEPVPG